MSHYEDLQINQGSDIVIKLECYNTDGSEKILNHYEDGMLTSLYQVSGKVKKTYNSNDSDSVIFGSNTFSAGNKDNIIELSLTNLQTDLMKAGRYVYDIELHSFDSDTNSNIVERILEGKITVTPSVTR